MFNVAVIRLKDLVRYLLLGIGIITIIILCKRYFNKQTIENLNIGQRVSNNINKYAQQAINLEVPGVQQIQNQEKEDTIIDGNSKNSKNSQNSENGENRENRENRENTDENLENKIFSKILKLELGAINAKEKKDLEDLKQDNSLISEHNTIKDNEKNNEQANNNKENGKQDNNKQDSKENLDENEEIKLAEKGLKTEVITKNPIADAYTKKYKSVKIKNETSIDLSDEMLDYSSLKINKSNIIVFHTHTCESYTSSEKYTYSPTGKYRTTDLKYSVARVGDELAKYLKKYNINVVHDKTYHDYPSYNGSYTRSLSTVTNLLKSTKADIIIDLHRDAIGSYSSYAPTVKIGNDVCAQVMFVMGSNGGGLKHPNWQNNLKFAVKMQETANKNYPGLFKPIILRNSRYNQHLGKAACIIEVGSTGNTLEQCLNSMKYLAEIINEI